MTKILIVEDEKAIAEVEKAYVLREGYEADIASDGAEALRMFNEGNYDLVLLDLMLPGKSGLDVLNEVKSFEDLREIPVVVMTASVAEEDRLQCDSLKVDGYIIKPFNLEKFLDLVRTLKKYWLDDVILPAVE